MPLTAKLRSTGKDVCILDYENPRQELAAEDLVCPHCDGPMIIRHGLIRAPHFAHLSRCPYEGWHEPETPEHRAFKRAVREYLLRDPFWKEAQVALEVRIPQAHRIADVFVTFPTGWRVAHECQVSPITQEELIARSRAYREAGIDVMWWFESGRLEQSRKWLPDWLLRFQGVILEAT
ncbi:MAG: hypothetical protein DRO93_15995, partial [Candidatus Thorarchaeota archaeon]